MASPKNWKRNQKDEGRNGKVFAWKNTKPPKGRFRSESVEIFVRKISIREGEKIKEVYKIDSTAPSLVQIEGERFNNKEKARKEVVKWMKSHPNP